MNNYNLYTRREITENNDPQRRCYNGCHYSTITYWGEWELLDINIAENKIEHKLTFWRELNEYSLSIGGRTKREYKAELVKEEPL